VKRRAALATLGGIGAGMAFSTRAQKASLPVILVGAQPIFDVVAVLPAT
jgi:hypothetical protein